MPTDRCRRDAAQLGDLFRRESIADHRADGDLDRRQLHVVSGDLAEERRRDLLKTAAKQRHVGPLAAGDFELQLEDDRHDDLLDVGGNRGLDPPFLLLQSRQYRSQRDIGLLESLMFPLNRPVGLTQVRQALHVHQNRADSLGHVADQCVFLLEERPGGPGGDDLAIEHLHRSYGPAFRYDVGGHPPLALDELLGDVSLVAVDDPRTGVFRELPAPGQTIDHALEEAVGGVEVHLTECRDRVEAVEFLDSLSQGDLDVGLRTFAIGGLHRRQMFLQGFHLFDQLGAGRSFGHSDYPSNAHEFERTRTQCIYDREKALPMQALCCRKDQFL